MKIARNLILSAALITTGAAQAANVGDSTPYPTFPYDVPPVYGFAPPTPAPVMNQEQIKAQQEAFETQRQAYEKAITEQQKLQAEAFAAQQKVMAEQAQRMREQYETVMKAQHDAQTQAVQTQQKTITEQREQMRKQFEAAMEAQQKAAENFQNYTPAPFALPSPQMTTFVPSFEDIEAQRQAITEHFEQLRQQHEAAREAHLKAIEEQRKLLDDRLAVMHPAVR